MAAIILDHPKHGSKVACMEDEAKADEKNGWVRRKVAALLQPATTSHVVDYKPDAVTNVLAKNTHDAVSNVLIRTEPDAAELESLRLRWQEKFGSKPHHKKSAATLRAELEA